MGSGATSPLPAAPRPQLPPPPVAPRPQAAQTAAPSAPSAPVQPVAPQPAQYVPPADAFCRSGLPVQPPAMVPVGPGERGRLLDDMMRDLPADSPLRQRARDASDSFSTPQLRRMQEAGVRFATEDGVPCERALPGTHSAERMRTPGRYLPEARTIQLRDSATTGEVMHEMAHAWDDVRNDRLRLRDDLRPGARTELMTRLNNEDAAGQELRLPAARRHAELRGTAAGFNSDTDRAIGAAYDAYQGRFQRREILREGAFDLGAEGHSRDNPREFYAEGFRVFHQDAGARERLIQNAPELYRYLYTEAQRDGTLPAGAPPPAGTTAR